jgi:hypothetical protein
MEQPRSLFGPLLLIGAGAVWLLVKAGSIPSANLWALTHVWPYLLIAAGLGLILRSYWQYTTLVLDVLIIGGLFLAIFNAPRLGWDKPSITGIVNFGDNDFNFGPGKPGSGNVVSETRQISGFNAIELDYPAQVFISQGGTESLKIEAEDNLLPGLQTQMRGNTLRIYYKAAEGERVNPTKMVKITIVVKDLQDVELNSAGELTIDGLETGKLEVSLSGAGNLKLNGIAVEDLLVSLSGAGSTTASGTADELRVIISGFGDFNGSDLHSQNADVNISGAGSANLWVDKELDATISGAGSVNYYGEAKVTRQVSGVGSVKHLGDK